MDNYGYSMPHGYSSNYTPKQDSINKNSSFESSTYGSFNTFKEDSLKDLERWARNFSNTVDLYVDEKYLYEMEKELQVESEDYRQEMKLSVSDNKGFLEDMRKGFDWYQINFTHMPYWFQKFKADYSIELKRLKRIKKYLSYRVRSLAGKRLYNETSKNMLTYIKIRIEAINILFNPKYNERTPLEDIYGISMDESNDDFFEGVNTNKVFSYD